MSTVVDGDRVLGYTGVGASLFFFYFALSLEQLDLLILFFLFFS